MFRAYRFVQQSYDPVAMLRTIRKLELDGKVSAESKVVSTDEGASLVWVVVTGPRMLTEQEMDYVAIGFAEEHFTLATDGFSAIAQFEEDGLREVIAAIEQK